MIRNESTGDRVVRIKRELCQKFPDKNINSETIIMTLQTEYLAEIHDMLLELTDNPPLDTT